MMVMLTRRYRGAVLTLALGAGVFSSAGALPAETRGVRSRPDSAAAAGSLTAVLDRIWEHKQAEQMALRVQFGLPIERLPDLSEAASRRDAAFAQSMLDRLRAIPDNSLTEAETLTKRSVAWEMQAEAEQAKYYWLDFGLITPYSTPLPAVVRMLATRNLADAAGRANYLMLLRQVPRFVDDIRQGLVDRAARQAMLPKAELPLVVDLVKSYLVTAPEQSAFAVSSSRLTAVDPGTARGFSSQATEIVRTQINPALERLVSYLEGPYVALARATVGVGHLPGGPEYYRFLVRYHTTLDVTPEQVHQIGLEAVAATERAMADVRKKLGFIGTQAQFHEKLRTDPRFFAKTPEEMGQRLTRYVDRIRPKVEAFFERTPRARGDVRRLDPKLEASQTFGYYEQPTAGDSMGHYYYNASKLPERTLLTAGPLVYHELIPGHHFQIMLAFENPSLHPLLRNTNYTAYSEGWGDYASGLAGEMGMYEDLYDRYGRLTMEMFLSCRLVVDTGMNGLGWSRERALEYMKEHTIESPVQLATETLRYSVDLPGQALGYEMGSREFLRLRERAKKALGTKFDIRKFHDVVLSSGEMPMSVLDWKVDRYIDRVSRGQ
jgi:uncharacterized protein (DUF885 family)